MEGAYPKCLFDANDSIPAMRENIAKILSCIVSKLDLNFLERSWMGNLVGQELSVKWALQQRVRVFGISIA